MGETPVRGFSVATRCQSVEEFVAKYYDRADESSILVNTAEKRMVGTECAFAILLANKQPVLAGVCLVTEIFEDTNNVFGRPGMRLQIKRLGLESERVFAELEARRLSQRAARGSEVDLHAAPDVAIPRRTTQPLRRMTTPVPVVDGAIAEPMPHRVTRPIRRLESVQIPTAEAQRAPRGTPQNTLPPEEKPQPPRSRTMIGVAAMPLNNDVAVPRTQTKSGPPLKVEVPKVVVEPRRRRNSSKQQHPEAKKAEAEKPRVSPLSLVDASKRPVMPHTGAARRTEPPREPDRKLADGSSQPLLKLVDVQPVVGKKTEPVARIAEKKPEKVETRPPPKLEARVQTKPLPKLEAVKPETQPLTKLGTNKTGEPPAKRDAEKLAKSVEPASKLVDADKLVADRAPSDRRDADKRVADRATRDKLAKPVEPSSKLVEPSSKPVEPSSKLVEPSSKPVEPSKHVEPSSKPVVADKLVADKATRDLRDADKLVADRATRDLRDADKLVTDKAPRDLRDADKLVAADKPKLVDTDKLTDADKLALAPTDAVPPVNDDDLPTDKLVAHQLAAADKLTVAEPVKIDPAKPKLELVPAERVPGSSFILPANPLSALDDTSLEGIIDSRLFESKSARVVMNVDEVAPGHAYESQPHAMLWEGRSAEPAPAHPQGERRPRESTPLPARRADREPTALSVAKAESQPVAKDIEPAPLPEPPTPGVGAEGTFPGAVLPDLPTPLVEPPVAAFVPSKPPRKGIVRLVKQYAGPLSVLGAFVVGFSAVALWITLRGPAVRAPVVTPAVHEAPDAPLVELAQEPTVKISNVAGKGPCIVNVTTDPSGASVWLQGRRLGSSPLELHTTCARQRIAATSPRFYMATQLVTPSQDNAVSVAVTLGRPMHTVLIKTLPGAAEVKYNGRSFGFTPTYVKVPGNTPVDLQISRPGFEPMTYKLTSTDSLGNQVSIPLKRAKSGR